MRKIYLESPFAGNIKQNITYARRAMRDSTLRNESAIASHLLWTQPGILDDLNPTERAQGIEAGFQWAQHADASVFYTDYGISPGMELGIQRAQQEGRTIEYRSIGKNPQTRLQSILAQAIDIFKATV